MKIVSGEDCIVCGHLDPIEGDCSLHRDKGPEYRGTGMRDLTRECADFYNFEEIFTEQEKERIKNQQIIDEYNAHPKIGDKMKKENK